MPLAEMANMVAVVATEDSVAASKANAVVVVSATDLMDSVLLGLKHKSRFRFSFGV